MDGSSYFPSRPEMEAEPRGVRRARRHRGPLRRALGVDGDARTAPDGTSVRARDDRRRVPRRRTSCSPSASREPWSPSPPGIELARHYADTRDAASYAGKRIFIIGKQNSGFELASGLAAWASAITVCSPSPAKTSIETQLAGRRPGALRPAVRGQLPRLRRRDPRRLDRRHRRGRRRAAGRSRAHRHRRGPERRGRRGDRRDRVHLPAARPAGARASRRSARPGCPRVTPFWESANVPGIFFAGHDQPGVAGPAQARHPRQLGRRPRAPLQRADPRPPHRARRASGSRSTGRSSPGRHRPVPPAGGRPAPPSCGTRRRTSRG